MKKIFILLTLALGACSILDQQSPNDVADELVFTSEEGANAALIGLYNTLQSRDYYGGYYPLIADLYSDIGVDGGFDNVALDEISVLDVTPSNIIIENTWLSIYNTIATANAIISRVDDINDPDFTNEEKAHIRGQALAIRALAHFDLLRMFGEHYDVNSNFGIPVVTTVQTADDVVARSTVQETYNAILSDLDDAALAILADDRSKSFINTISVEAIRARVLLHAGRPEDAAAAATQVIEDGTYAILDEFDFKSMYVSPYLSDESIFELAFNVQNRSAFNAATFSRTNALRTEVLFLAESSMSDFFASRTEDARASLIDFVNNDESIIPDGRTLKYRGEETRDNPAYILRLADVYLIRAEALGLSGGGLDDLNLIRTQRGMTSLLESDFTDEAEFLSTVLDERKAELNFEGTRMFDLARTGKVTEILDLEAYRAIFPIPLREIIATDGVILQNPGYPQ
jgi:hypothetical protein